MTNSNAPIKSATSLENKFQLMIGFAFDRRVGRKHMLVYGFILDWWHQKYGDALASVRHIVTQLQQRDPDGKGLYMGDVHSALADLVDWGYLTQEKGSGRRASRYVPVWTRSVRAFPNNKEDSPSVLDVPNTDVRKAPNAKPDCVLGLPNKDPSTVTRSTDPGNGIDGLSDAPLASAGAVAPPAPGADPFEDLWRAYGVRRDKKAARRVYEQLSPKPEQQLQMLAAAHAWRAGAGPIQRMSLGRWIEAENWDCDPPKPFERPATLANVAKEPTKPANDNTARHAIIKRKPEAVEFRIANATIHSEPGDFTDLSLLFEVIGGDWAGTVERRTMSLQHRDPYKQDADLKAFAQLCHAVGVTDGVEEVSMLEGRRLTVHTDEQGRASYHPSGTPLTVEVA